MKSQSSNRKLKWILASAAMLALAGGGIAAAQGGHGPGKRGAMMQKFDANGDGKLDDAERAKLREAREARRAERIAKFDADQDGALSPAERAAMRDARAAARFAALDTDGDGKLSLEEFKAGHASERGRGHHRRPPVAP